MKRKLPNALYDKDGHRYDVIFQAHRDGFNLITFRLNYDDYEEY